MNRRSRCLCSWSPLIYRIDSYNTGVTVSVHTVLVMSNHRPSFSSKIYTNYFPVRRHFLSVPADMSTILQICCIIWFNVDKQAYCTLHRVTRLAANCYYLYYYYITRTPLMTVPEKGFCYSNTFFQNKTAKTICKK